MNEQGSSRRHPNVANVSEVDVSGRGKGSRFGCSHRWLSAATGARGIGCSWYEVAPGRSMCPHHYHSANEESIFVLEGEGELRLGQDRVRVGPGDYMAFPVGPEYAHQLTNIGNSPLRYLCFSTRNPVEVVGYPDSNKVAAIASPGPGQPAWVASWFPANAAVDYFHGEDVGEVSEES